MLRIVFAGVPECAVPALNTIARNFNLCAVLTSPPARAGRTLLQKPSETAQAAEALKADGIIPQELPVFTPSSLDADFRAELSALNPELLVCFAYGKIFGAKTMSLFPKGGINIHPSLLPRWRGCSPVPASIYAGDKETGVTIQTIAPEPDSGDILASIAFPLNAGDTAESVLNKSAVLGAGLLFEVLNDFENKKKNAVPQNSAAATYCTALTKADGLINWNKPAEEIERQIRAFTPWPGTYTFCRGKKLNIIKAVLPHAGEDGFELPENAENGIAGKVLKSDGKYGILIGTGKGVLAARELQWETKKKLSWKDFLNGSPKFLNEVLTDKI